MVQFNLIVLLAVLLVVYCSIFTMFFNFWIICGRFTTPYTNVGCGLAMLILASTLFVLKFSSFVRGLYLFWRLTFSRCCVWVLYVFFLLTRLTTYHGFFTDVFKFFVTCWLHSCEVHMFCILVIMWLLCLSWALLGSYGCFAISWGEHVLCVLFIYLGTLPSHLSFNT